MEKSPQAFRTISEAASELDVPQHVLRFWETKFKQIKPMKRGGGRRFYRPQDVDLIKGIKFFLYNQGHTIKGVQKILAQKGVVYTAKIWQEFEDFHPKLSDETTNFSLTETPIENMQALGDLQNSSLATHDVVKEDLVEHKQKQIKLQNILQELNDIRKMLSVQK